MRTRAHDGPSRLVQAPEKSVAEGLVEIDMAGWKVVTWGGSVEVPFHERYQGRCWCGIRDYFKIMLIRGLETGAVVVL